MVKRKLTMKKLILLLSLVLLSCTAIARITPPPTGSVYMEPEWAEKEGIIMRYPFGFGTSLFANMIDNFQDYGVVYIIVENTAVQSDLFGYLSSHGVPWENIECIYAPTVGNFNGEWTRDYGPLFIWVDDSTLSINDLIYFPMQQTSDAIPEVICDLWHMPYYGPNIREEGGNLMTDGHGAIMMTDVVFDKNPGMTMDELQQIYQEYFGQDTAYVFENFIDDRLGHIDGWAKIVNDTTILVARLHPSDPNYQLVENHAASMDQIPTFNGGTFHIVRCQLPDPWYYTYINGTLFNGLALVPVYGFDLDQQALESWQEALGPNWTIVGLNCYLFSMLGGAIHCTTMEVPKHDWDYLVNADLTFEPYSTPIVIPAIGGSFDFNLEIENIEPDTIQFDLWIDVTLPNGNIYGPLLKREGVTMVGYGQIARDLTQVVPGNASSGSYIYNAYIGSYLPRVISAEQNFAFEKLGGTSGEFNLSGWRVIDTSEQQPSGDVAQTSSTIIHSASPNPFNPTTAISYQLSAMSFVNLTVYDIQGRQVAELVNGWRDAGVHEVTFDASNLASGIYLYRIEASGSEATPTMKTGKMVLVK